MKNNANKAKSQNNGIDNLYSRKDENYITIFGWMTNRLKLSGNELLVYALIFSFAKDGKTEFHDSAEYTAKALNMSRITYANSAHHIKEIDKDYIDSDNQKVITFLCACKNAGFSLDEKKAEEILNTGIDFSWFIEPFTYPDYIAWIIRDLLTSSSLYATL